MRFEAPRCRTSRYVTASSPADLRQILFIAGKNVSPRRQKGPVRHRRDPRSVYWCMPCRSSRPRDAGLRQCAAQIRGESRPNRACLIIVVVRPGIRLGFPITLKRSPSRYGPPRCLASQPCLPQLFAIAPSANQILPLSSSVHNVAAKSRNTFRTGNNISPDPPPHLRLTTIFCLITALRPTRERSLIVK